jgi:hypothetical protein
LNELGLELGTPDEAGKILKLKGGEPGRVL